MANDLRSVTAPASTRADATVANAAATRDFWLTSRVRDGGKLVKPYAQHGMTYAAMHATATNLAQVPFLIHAGADEETEDVLRDGPWVSLFDRPNPTCKYRAKFFEQIVLDLLDDRGECFVVKEGRGDEPVSEGEIPAELWPISGRYFDYVLDKETKLPMAWIYRSPSDPKPVVYQPEQLVLFQLSNPYDKLRGLGPLASAAVAMAADYKASRFNEAFFDNDATPGGVLVSQKPLNREQRQQITEAWEERHQGTTKRRRVAMLEGGLDYKETGISQREMEFTELRHTSWQEILAILGVPEYIVGLTENLNNATAQAEEKGWWIRSIFPLMRVLEDGFWEQLFSPAEGNARSLARTRSAEKSYRLRKASYTRPRARCYARYEQYRGARSDASRVGFSTESRVPGSDVWGEFDLSTVEALRENFTEKVNTANVLRTMGYPLNEINQRTDLGMEDMEPEIGDVSLVPNTLVPSGSLQEMADANLEATKNPPQPVVAPGTTAGKATEKPPAPSQKAEKQLDREEIRRKVTAFLARRPMEREKIWLRQTQATAPIEARFRTKFTRWLKELRDWQLKALAKYPSSLLPRSNGPAIYRAPNDHLTPEQIKAAIFDSKSWGKRLSSLEHVVYVDAAKQGVESAIQQLGGNFAFDVVDPRVVDVINQREVKLAKVSDTVNKLVEKTLQRGVENGETISQLQDRLKPYFNQLAGSRSLMVARTEIAGATNSARNLVYQEEGVESTQWITARDEAVRDSHAELDGDEAPVGTPFANGLLYPGDPAGPPEEVINCRCVAIPSRK